MLAVFSSFAPLNAQSIVQSVGVGKPFSNLQDSIALSYYLSLEGNIGGLPDGLNLGMVKSTAQPRNLSGLSLADGHSLPIGSNPNLFSLTNTTYGGNGSSNFNIPNIAGRAIVGVGTAVGTPAGNTNWTLGMKQGAATITLTEKNLPSHVHSLPGGKFTAPSGNGVPFDNAQPSIGLNYLIRTSGEFPADRSGSGAGTAGSYIGTVVPWVGSLTNIPEGWTPADGRTLSLSSPQNRAVYAVIGERFGGNHGSEFQLPDLRGRTIVGAGERLGGVGSPVGERFGRDLVSILGEMPMHTHPITPTGTSGGAGLGLPLDHRQPSLALSYAIAVGAPYPPSENPDSTVYLGEVIAFAGDYAPPGFLLADGRTLNASEYNSLFALLGNTYGGDGVTNFKLPDLRARTIIGAGPSAPVGTLQGLAPGIAFAALDENGNLVYDVGELAGASDFLLDEENLGEHGYEVIPEPSTLTLIGMSTLSAMFVRRRRP